MIMIAHCYLLGSKDAPLPPGGSTGGKSLKKYSDLILYFNEELFRWAKLNLSTKLIKSSSPVAHHDRRTTVSVSERLRNSFIHSFIPSSLPSFTHERTNEGNFLMYCQEYDNIRHELHSLISKSDYCFSDDDKIRYLLTPDKETL